MFADKDSADDSDEAEQSQQSANEDLPEVNNHSFAMHEPQPQLQPQSHSSAFAKLKQTDDKNDCRKQFLAKILETKIKHLETIGTTKNYQLPISVLQEQSYEQLQELDIMV